MKSRLIRTLMVVFCLVAGAPATQANTESSLCRTVSLPSLCRQGGASASNADSTGTVSVMPPSSSSISLDLKPAVQNSGVGGLRNIVRITTPGRGIYYKPANVTRLLIRAIGGGGGGCFSVDGGTARGGGGGAGGYSELLVSSPSSSYAYTVGRGGDGGYACKNGDATTIAGITAAGGGGGGSNVGGLGGTAWGGDINVRGGDGTGDGHGGSSMFGGAGRPGIRSWGGNGAFGGGGGGNVDGGGLPGGRGGDGYIEIWEF